MRFAKLVLLFVVLCTGCVTTRERPNTSELRRSVAKVDHSLHKKKYDIVVKTLFGLTDKKEIELAIEHLQRPRCLTMYEQIFRELVKLKPTLHPKSEQTATFKIEKPIVIGTDKWDKFENMEVLFWFNGSEWIFSDPSFERKLGRKIIPRED